MFKIEDGFNLQLQTPVTMKLFASAENLIDKKNNGTMQFSRQSISIKVGSTW